MESRPQSLRPRPRPRAEHLTQRPWTRPGLLRLTPPLLRPRPKEFQDQDRDRDLIFNKNPVGVGRHFAIFEIIHFLSQNFWGLGGFDRLLWVRPRPGEHKTETKIPGRRLRRDQDQQKLSLKTGLETSVTGQSALITHSVVKGLLHDPNMLLFDST